MKNPLYFYTENAMKPFEWADVELVDPLGF